MSNMFAHSGEEFNAYLRKHKGKYMKDVDPKRYDRCAHESNSLAEAYRKAGVKVVRNETGKTPEGIVKAAMDEDVDVIGVSYLSGEHLIFTPKIVAEMKRNGLDDVLLIAGGTFPAEDIPAMEEMGIDKVFRAGSLTDSIIDYIHHNV